jgi:hypothetical protein
VPCSVSGSWFSTGPAAISVTSAGQFSSGIRYGKDCRSVTPWTAMITSAQSIVVPLDAEMVPVDPVDVIVYDVCARSPDPSFTFVVCSAVSAVQPVAVTDTDAPATS